MPTNTGPVIVVTSSAELRDAYEQLSTMQGGGEIHIAPGSEDILINLDDGGPHPVTITSADPDNPVTLTQIDIADATNITVRDVHVDSSDVDRPDWHSDLNISGSSDITITNVTFQSDASGLFRPADPDAVLGENLGYIRSSTDITFSNNSVDGYYQGLSVQEASHITVSGNTLTHMQGDGIRLGSAQHVEITDNVLRDFYGTVQSYNHSDMLQIWATNPDIPTTDILISGNVFDSGDGQATQTIFIRNEALDAGKPGAQMHSDITITNNLIYNGHKHGISLSGVDGATISDNTLLWNDDARIMKNSADLEGSSTPPTIRLSNVDNATVTNNVTAGVVDNGSNTISGNFEVNYGTPQDPDYVEHHFVSLPDGADGDVTDVSFNPESPWVGTGAEATDPMLVSADGVVARIVSTVDGEDPQTVLLDAGYSVDTAGFTSAGGYTYQWTFADGSVLQGEEVRFTFDTPGKHDVQLQILDGTDVVATEGYVLSVTDRNFLELDFESGLFDTSSYATQLISEGAELITTTDGVAVRIGEQGMFATDRSTDQIHDLKSFALNIDMTVLEDSNGFFLQMGHVMRGYIDEEGGVNFSLQTSDGTFTVNSGTFSMHDSDASHTISIGYSDSQGILEMRIDDELVGEVAASGTTAAQGSHGLNFGSPWNTTVEALINGVYLGADPADAGLITDVDATGGGGDPAPVSKPVVNPADGFDPNICFFPAFGDAPGDTTAPVETLLGLNFEENLSAAGLTLSRYDAGQLTQGDTGTAYAIGDGAKLIVDRSNDEIHEMDQFGLSIDIAIDDPTQVGQFIHFPKVMEAALTEDGMVRFILKTDEGAFKMQADAALLTDGQTHNFQICYSDAHGEMQMRIDGDIVATSEASGQTADVAHWGLTIGSNWQPGIDALVDNIYFTDEIMVVDQSGKILADPTPQSLPATLAAAQVAAADVAENTPETAQQGHTEPDLAPADVAVSDVQASPAILADLPRIPMEQYAEVSPDEPAPGEIAHEETYGNDWLI